MVLYRKKDGKMKSRTGFFRIFLAVCLLALLSTVAYADMIKPGLWKQTGTTAGDCLECTVSITQLTPHIVQLEANNGWYAYAYYVEEEDAYHGFLELKKFEKGTMQNWLNKVFSIRLVQDQITLNLQAEFEDIQFHVTYRRVKDQ